jgi:polysaccharide biosynthesis protein PslG
MTRRLLKLATVLTVLTVGLALPALLGPASDASTRASARKALAAPLGGVNVPGLDRGSTPRAADSEIAAAKSLHAAIVRVAVPWSVLEPLGAGRVSSQALAFTDRLVGDAAAAGIRVIMTVYSSPCWASSAPATLLRKCDPGRVSNANAWPPSNPGDYAAFTAYLAGRYGNKLAAIEIWNEPDQANQLYFAGPQKPERYAAILRSAYPAIKAANGSVSVIAGSLVGSNGAFLQALYANGIKGYFDGLAVHFYNLVLASVRSIHEVQLAHGDSKPLWLDEFGWSSCYPRQRIQEEQACVTRPIQGSNLSDVFHSLARTPYVAAEAMYNLQDSGHEQFGVLNGSGARKPAFQALSRALASPFAGARRVKLSLRRSGRRVIASGTAPVGDFMQLEAFRGAVLRYRALFVLDRFDRYSISLPAVLGTRGLRVRVFQYWTGPAQAAQRSI